MNHDEMLRTIEDLMDEDTMWKFAKGYLAAIIGWEGAQHALALTFDNMTAEISFTMYGTNYLLLPPEDDADDHLYRIASWDDGKGRYGDFSRCTADGVRNYITADMYTKGIIR